MTLLEDLKAAPIYEAYELEAPLWRTSESAMFRARQRGTGRLVAVKCLLELPAELQGMGRDEVTARFLREIRLLSRLESPHILRLIDAGIDHEAGGLPYLVTEFADGQTLAERLEEGPLSPRLTRRVIRHLLEALAEAHELGVIHRDLKPGNILLTRSRDTVTARLMGFDVAGLQQQPGEGFIKGAKITAMGERRGTPGYMAPELMQFFSDPQPTSDLYAAGLILYECLVGQRALTGTAAQIIQKQIEGPLPLPPLITPSPFAKIISRACKRIPANRYPTASDMLEDLERLPRRKLSTNPLTEVEEDLSSRLDLPIDDQYEVMGELGRGGFGVVLKARQRATGQLVAIKKMIDSPRSSSRGPSESARREFELRFWREVQLIGQLRSPYTVKLIGAGFDDGRPYMVLEFIEGTTLDDLLIDGGPLRPKQLRRIFTQVLEALAEAHERGIVHRDLKPANIMVTDVGGLTTAKVLDFGLAGIVQQYTGESYQKVSRYGQARGTPSYVAPEQLVDFSNARIETDFYALGLIIYECLLAEKAFDGASGPEICQRQLTVPLTLPPALAETDHGAIIERTSKKNPDERFRSATELLAALSEASDVKTERALERAGLYQKRDASPPPRPLPIAAGLGVLALIIALLVSVFAL